MEVKDEENCRVLYFKNNVVQSRISLKEPHVLLLRYTRYLMGASLLINPRPLKILLIGVGAGAIVHFIHHYLPQTHLVAVDYSEHILKIARGYFALPENDYITVLRDDGLNYLMTIKEKQKFDLILVDAFNDVGMAKNIYSNEFFRLAKEQLTEEGVICANLWSGNRTNYQLVRKSILKNSEDSLFIPVRQRENEIAVSFQTPIPWNRVCPDKDTLNQLKNTFGFNFDKISVNAKNNNLKLGERIRLWLS